MRRVVKWGGSLLGQPGIFARFESWLATRPRATTLVVVGGGQAVDWWRALDAAHGLDPELMHTLALGTMTANARVVRSQLKDAGWVEQVGERAPELGVLNPLTALAALELEVEALPRSWDVTSDSIAAWIALHWQADELVLLKSGDPPPEVARWSQLGFVDAHFSSVGYPPAKVSAWNFNTEAR